GPGGSERCKRDSSKVVPTEAKEIGIDELTFEALREVISLTFGNTADLQSDVIRVGKSEGCIYYLETVVNTEMLKEMLGNTLENSADKDIVVDTIEDLQRLSKKSFGVSGYKLLKKVNEIVSSLLEGRIVIVFRGVGQALSLTYLNSEGRTVAEPTTQTVVRGPKDSFVEDASTNINLIRKRIRNHQLRFEKFMIGNETRTNVYMGYMYS
ncbi:spore germination protein, partial [Streptococcus hyovaginalis]